MVKKILILFMIIGVAACGKLPRPFETPAGAPPNPLVEKGVVDGLWVAPLSGTTRPMADLLSKSIVQQLERYDIIASSGEKVPSNFILEGKVRINDNDPTVPYVILIDWTLYDRNGVKERDFSQGVEGSRWEWDYGSPEVIREVGEGVAKHLATVVGLTRKIKQVAEAPSLLGRDGLWIENTVNAPGDGAQSLPRAIRFRLIAKGVTLARDKNKAKYVLFSRVDLSAPRNNKQTVKITWRVKNAKGRQIGQAVQKNAVPTGIFSGKWGRMAGLVATAAVDGIVNILNIGENSLGGLLPGLKPLGIKIPNGNGEQPLPQPTEKPGKTN